MSSSHVLYTPVIGLVAELRPKLVLDVGAGYGIWSFLITRHFRREDRPYLVAVEIFEAYTRPLKDFIADEVVVASATALPFKPQSFDLGVCCEVMEHLRTREEGLVLLGQLRTAAKSALVTTPANPPSQVAYDGNPWNMHRLKWERDDFKAHNWDVQILGGKEQKFILATYTDR